MERRAAAADAARSAILEAALDELVAAGGEPITMQAVARRADMALRTLYNHFPGRGALLSAAYLRHAAQTRAAVEAVAAPDAGPQEQLRHIIEAYYAGYARMGTRLTALLSVRGDPELDEQVRAIRAWRRRLLGDVVGAARRSGALAAPARDAVAVAFTMTSHAAWLTLVEELGRTAGDATRVAADALNAALFRTP
jgi:AcrR family transcriptional regulator